MNIFILCTGRCGSTTFIKACQHITNYTAAHESRSFMIGPERVAYPDNHIEADNRLSWFLGKLENAYGNDAFYVHLQREIRSTAKSFLKRWDFGIMKSYRTQIVMGLDKKTPDIEKIEVCVDYCETVNQNIKAFLKD